MKAVQSWIPPGKNCGQCGEENCLSFMRSYLRGVKEYRDCPYYEQPRERQVSLHDTRYTGQDVLGHEYDFVLSPLPKEISARKIILPFRPDLVEKMEIQAGDYVLGRPMGAGCPVPHVLQVIKAEPITGLLTTWVVGPRISREREVKNVEAYHMIGFEGLATRMQREPVLGARVSFLPGLCMMNLNHTALVNMILKKTEGIHLRLEDIRILASGE